MGMKFYWIAKRGLFGRGFVRCATRLRPSIDPLTMNPPIHHETSGTGSSDLASDGANAPAKQSTLRTWPPLLLISLGILTRFGPSHLEGGMSSYWMAGLMGPLLCSVLILIWWLTHST